MVSQFYNGYARSSKLDMLVVVSFDLWYGMKILADDISQITGTRSVKNTQRGDSKENGIFYKVAYSSDSLSSVHSADIDVGFEIQGLLRDIVPGGTA